MEMYYDGALVMPKNYAVVNEEEMTYVEGGATAYVYSSAKDIQKRLSNVICASLVETGLCAAIGFILGGVFGAVITGGLADGYFYSWRNCAGSAYDTVQNILNQYGNVQCVLKTSYTLGAYVTGMTVTKL